MAINTVNEFQDSGIIGVTQSKFSEVLEKLRQWYDCDEEVKMDVDEELPTVTMTFRDADNYKHPFRLQLATNGDVLVGEPEWEQDEDEDRDYFWSVLREQFEEVA